MATRTRKFLVGCGAGCLGLIVLSIGACVSFSIWVNQPGELLEPQRLLGRETAGYAELVLREDDAGARQFMTSLIDAQQRLEDRSPQSRPAWLNHLARQNRARNREQMLDQFLPSAVAWTLSPGDEPARDRHLFTVSVRSFGNRARFMDVVMRFTLGLKLSARYKDERIYSIEEAGSMFIRDGSFFITNNEDNARHAIDRLRAETWESERDPTELELRFAEVGDSPPLRGAIGNHRGELWRIWQTFGGLDPADEPPPVFRAIRGATVSGDFVDERGFRAVLVLQGPHDAWAASAADELLALMRETYGRGHLPAEFGASAQGDRVTLTVHFEDVLGFIEEL